MREPRDKTEEVTAASGKLDVWLYNYCDFFEQDTDRLFANRECWYCKYGDFGIFTEHPMQNGVCSYKASKKQEEETK